MNKAVKITLWILAGIFGIALIAGIGYFLTPYPSDYGTFVKMREYTIGVLKDYSCSQREITNRFTDYKLNLNPLNAFMFKSGNLSLFLKCYSSDMIANAAINQLEIGSNTGNFFDFTFMIRPRPGFSTPFFHGDALKALPGVNGALYMDFYSLDETINVDAFFGIRKDKLLQAIELGKPYWNTEKFGHLTPHLDPFKSPYRFEILEPKNGTENEKKEYFKTALTCYTLYLEAYLESLALQSPTTDANIIEENSKKIKNFVSILYAEDIAVKLGKMIFPEEDFGPYFLEGFWGVGALQ